MKTNQSSAECAAYNAKNKDAIAAGLLEAVEPDDQTLAKESAENQKSKQNHHAATILGAVWDGLSTQGKRIYADPRKQLRTNQFRDRWTLDPAGSGMCVKTVVIEWYSTGRYHISGYYRCVIGDYGNKSIVKIGSGDQESTKPMQATHEQVAKMVVKVEALVKATVDELEYRRAKQEKGKRNAALEASNPLLCRALNIQHYADSSESQWFVKEDGTLNVRGEEFTVDQWIQIVVLQENNRKAEAALKASFAKGGAK